jgi:hypothetical protein
MFGEQADPANLINRIGLPHTMGLFPDALETQREFSQDEHAL